MKKIYWRENAKKCYFIRDRKILSLLSIDQYNYSIIITLIILLKFYF